LRFIFKVKGRGILKRIGPPAERESVKDMRLLSGRELKMMSLFQHRGSGEHCTEIP
jgi:hypothetical protein